MLIIYTDGPSSEFKNIHFETGICYQKIPVQISTGNILLHHMEKVLLMELVTQPNL